MLDQEQVNNVQPGDLFFSSSKGHLVLVVSCDKKLPVEICKCLESETGEIIKLVNLSDIVVYLVSFLF